MAENKKVIMLGNEAIARGAYEARCESIRSISGNTEY